MKRVLLLCSLFLFTAYGTYLQAQKTSWPKEIPFPKTGGKLIIYQPQPDALEGNKLSGRAAISAKEKGGEDPIFGALFFEATLFTDKARHTATLESIKITNAKITGVDDQEKITKLIAFIEAEVPKWDMEISLDELTATIRKAHPNAEIYNNNPPVIIFREKPTTLVILDGEPKIQKDKNLDAERVINSPNLIFKEENTWNMYVGGTWYQSASVKTGWVPAKGMSKKVKSVNDQIKKQEKEQNNNKDITAKPELTDIIVATVPTELLQTKGKPEYKKIDSTNLQYVSNTANDIFKDPKGTIYILLAGRWYKSASLSGPWTFNESDKMPDDFAKIPEGSEKDNVLVSISGTDAAEEAIIDAEIPQTAKVDRKTATVKVEYDGDPKLQTIEGTGLQFVQNANLTVLREETSGRFFALDNGVWFISNSSKGPWKVSDTRPVDLDKIPAKSPAYNAKFVHIYEATADYVIVGYTAGYLGSYVQGDPTIIFGTGFYYAPWYGSIYYPRPATWGFNFCYNPFFGWSMGFGYNIGFLHIGFGFGGGYGYGGGWFGPPMYRPPYRPPYYGGGYYGHGRRPVFVNNGNININNNHNNIYRPGNGGNNNRPGISNRPSNTNRPGNNYRPGNNGNATGNRPGNRPGNNGNNGSIGNNRPGNNRPTAPAAKTPNNVFADKSGNVFQKDNKGAINQRDNKSNSWKPSNPSVGGNMNRDAQLRDRGTQRNNNFNNVQRPQSRPSMGNAGGAARSMPANRAGGVRRR
ncbi:MAG: hypothetical protein RLZZ28_341 [Bacteroidota bacterium]|jgi:hypothetical protein